MHGRTNKQTELDVNGIKTNKHDEMNEKIREKTLKNLSQYV